MAVADGAGRTDERLMRLDKDDNVLIATKPISSGERFLVEGREVCAERDVPAWFKVAAWDLRPGEVVLRLGTAIGRVTTTVSAGGIVHTHNMVSQRIATTIDREEH